MRPHLLYNSLYLFVIHFFYLFVSYLFIIISKNLQFLDAIILVLFVKYMYFELSKAFDWFIHKNIFLLLMEIINPICKNSMITFGIIMSVRPSVSYVYGETHLLYKYFVGLLVRGYKRHKYKI